MHLSIALGVLLLLFWPSLQKSYLAKLSKFLRILHKLQLALQLILLPLLYQHFHPTKAESIKETDLTEVNISPYNPQPHFVQKYPNSGVLRRNIGQCQVQSFSGDWNCLKKLCLKALKRKLNK